MQATTVRTYRPEKTRVMERLEALAKKSSVIMLSQLYKVRTAQLMMLRKNFRADLEIVVAKNRITSLALNKAGLKNMDEFIKKLKGQNAFIFTNMDPFKLNLILERSKVNLPAKGGDIATDEIAIPAGNTGLPAGPIISDFKEAGVHTRIDTGSVWVTKDTVVAKQGDVISMKLAGLLSRLNLKPIKAGISISTVYWNGLILNEKDIKIDLEEFEHGLLEAYSSALTLAIGISYTTRETLPSILNAANLKARSLSIILSYMTKETASEILAKDNAEAVAFYNLAKQKGYN